MNSLITKAYINLAAAIVRSGVIENDTDFLESDWHTFLKEFVSEYYFPKNSVPLSEYIHVTF